MPEKYGIQMGKAEDGLHLMASESKSIVRCRFRHSNQYPRHGVSIGAVIEVSTGFQALLLRHRHWIEFPMSNQGGCHQQVEWQGQSTKG